MKELLDIYNTIKNDLDRLTDYKLRGNTIEVSLPFFTLNNKSVSVFIKKLSDKIVVSDGGWLEMGFYNSDEEIKITDSKRVKDYYKESYQIKDVEDANGNVFYYKDCKNLLQVPALVFDVSNFIMGIVNSQEWRVNDKKEVTETAKFNKEVSSFFREKFNKNLLSKKGLGDSVKTKFDAIITKDEDMYFFSFVTGSTKYHFENKLYAAIVNFELTKELEYQSNIKEKVTIINNKAKGYDAEELKSSLSLLNDKTTRAPINWSDRNKILDVVG